MSYFWGRIVNNYIWEFIQLNISHFQDTVYWAMSSSDCSLSTNYQSLWVQCLLCDVFKWLQFVNKLSVTFRTLCTVRCLQVTAICQQTITHSQDTVYCAMSSSYCNLSTNYQSLSGYCLLSYVFKWLQFVNKLSVTFRTLFTERCLQVTEICQQTISHFQDTVYYAMSSSDCSLSTNYLSLSGHCLLSDTIKWLSLLFSIERLPASIVVPRQAILPKMCRNLLQHFHWNFVLLLLKYTAVTSPMLEGIYLNLTAVTEFKIDVF